MSSLLQSGRCGVWKTVSCEQCGADYAYRLERDRPGHQSPRAFETALRRCFDPVFCPQCGAYQRHMFGAVRRSRYGVFVMLALASMLFGFVVGGFWSDGSFIANALGSPAVAFHLLGLVLIAAGQVKMARFNPNAACHDRRGIRQHRHVILRAEYEALRAHVRAKGEKVVSLRWLAGHVAAR